MILKGGIELLDHKDVINFYRNVMDNYQVPKNKKIALFLPCTAIKPYSASKTHKKIKEVIDNSCDGTRRTIHELIISEPLGIVPRELEMNYPAAYYDMILDSWFPVKMLPILREKGEGNDISKVRKLGRGGSQQNKVIRVLSERVAKFLEKTEGDYRYRVGFVRSTHKEILKKASELSDIDVEFIITPKFTQEVIREKGTFYWIMNGMRCKESMKLLNKTLTEKLKEVI